MILTMEEFVALRDFICEKTGLFFQEKKIFFIKKRLQTRLEATGVKTPKEYVRLLKFSDPHGEEFQQLANLITTNETYFFREFDQLACFAEDCLPELQKRKPTTQKDISVWCAACSTGEEAYTLSIILTEMLPPEWQYSILANDIDEKVLQHARNGIYSDRSIKDMPAEYYQHYMVPTDQGHQVSPLIATPIQFKHMNLMDRASVKQHHGFDAIFCRNVLIYFDEASRKMMVEFFYNALNPGGYIFLGSSESVGRITTRFLLRRYGSHLVYQKPD